MTDHITVQYDIAHGSMWECFAQICVEMGVDDSDMIVFARGRGYAPNGCPILEVQFANLDVAQSFTGCYMGLEADDEDVLEYLGVVDHGLEAA